MARVISLIGGNRGKEVEMPFTVAQACVANGTAMWVGSPPPRIRGMTPMGEAPASAPAVVEPPAPVAEAPIAVSKPARKVSIPADWRLAHHLKRMGWAKKIDPSCVEDGLTAAEADAVIEKFLAGA